MNDAVDKRISELESRVAFQDDTVLRLNDIVAAQQADIDRLQMHIRDLASVLRNMRDNMNSGGDESPPDSERPPHY